MIYPRKIIKTKTTLATILLALCFYLLLQTRFADQVLQHFSFVDLHKNRWPGLLPFYNYSFVKKTPYLLSLARSLSTDEPWRYITPSLLHLSLNHLVFNLLWFSLFAPDLERKLGALRSFLLLSFASVASNFTQYFFQGPFFLGLSGVNAFLLGMTLTGSLFNAEGVTKKNAAKVGSYFMILVALIDLILYFLRKFHIVEIPSLQIAHFGHLSGWLIGILLGPFIIRFPFILSQFRGKNS